MLLKQKLRRRIADARILELLDLIIDSAPATVDDSVYFIGDDLLTPLERHRGPPIGNLTSQFLANLYPDDLDHQIKEVLRVPAYLLYVDDLILLGDDKARLRQIAADVAGLLEQDRLRLRPGQLQVQRIRDGVDVLGYRVFPNYRRLRPDNGHRFARRLRAFARAYARGDLRWADIDASVQSWIGHARHADSEGLRRVIFGRTIFSNGAGH